MPRKNIIEIGTKINMLTIIEDLGNNYNGRVNRQVRVKCDCGNEIICAYGDIKNGKTKSCGCYMKMVNKDKQTKHGMSSTRIYKIWKDMRRRCNNSSRKNYQHYGGRGVKVCDDWNNDFMAFYSWSMDNNYNEALSIDRIDPDGDYCPDNCRWVTQSIQNGNKTTFRKFEAMSPNGEIYYHHNKYEFAQMHGLSNNCIRYCLTGKQKTHRGWTFKYVE